jgi:hypothetical protein
MRSAILQSLAAVIICGLILAVRQIPAYASSNPDLVPNPGVPVRKTEPLTTYHLPCLQDPSCYGEHFLGVPWPQLILFPIHRGPNTPRYLPPVHAIKQQLRIPQTFDPEKATLQYMMQNMVHKAIMKQLRWQKLNGFPGMPIIP